jgi:hypothetical protein
VAVSEGHAFVATGNDVVEIDARTPSAMVSLGSIVPPGQTANAVDVIVSLLPGQTWVVALEATGDVVYIKRDGRLTRYERCSEDQNSPECALELERYDPTRSGRDPSFDPVMNQFDSPAVDPSAVLFARQTRTILAGGARRLARPAYFETIGTLSGRRYRDSFMPGSSVLSAQVMQRMRNVEVCELKGTPSNNPAGLDELGYFLGGACEPFSSSRKPKRRKPARTELACQNPNLDPITRGIVCGEDSSKDSRAQQLVPKPTVKLPVVRASIRGTAS